MSTNFQLNLLTSRNDFFAVWPSVGAENCTHTQKRKWQNLILIVIIFHQGIISFKQETEITHMYSNFHVKGRGTDVGIELTDFGCKESVYWKLKRNTVHYEWVAG